MLTQKHQKLIEHGLRCPACGQMTRRQWWQERWQEPGKPARPPMGQTDCLNPNCDAYYATLETGAFFARFAGGAK